MSCLEYNNSDCVEKLEKDFNSTDIKTQIAYLDKEICQLFEERSDLIRKLQDLNDEDC